MTVINLVVEEKMKEWLLSKPDKKLMEHELTELGCTAEEITLQLFAYKKLRQEKRQFSGFVCLGVGAMLGFISCVLSILNPIPELYNVILFGFTSLSICIIMLGLYFLFE